MTTQKFLSWEAAVDWLVAQPEQQDLVRACYYDRPVVQAAERFWAGAEWQAIRKLLPASPARALDVGAGAGISSYALARDGWQVTALEPDGSHTVGAGAIRQLAEDNGLDITVVQEFGERIAAPDAAYEVVHARQVLHHATDLFQFCRELHRVLKPGGVLVTTRDHVISGPAQLPQFLEAHPLHRFYGGENAFRVRDYRAALTRAGFVIEHAYGPFDSVINYAPRSRDELRHELVSRLEKLPGGFVAQSVLRFNVGLDFALWLLSRLDRRPGRLHTFVARKVAL